MLSCLLPILAVLVFAGFLLWVIFRKRQKPIPCSTFSEKLREVENELRHHPKHIETAFVLSDAGRVLVHRSKKVKEGEPHIIDTFTQAEMEAVTGNTITHNHSVTGDSFSPQDIRFLLKHHPRQLRAVGPEFTYAIEVKPRASLTWEDVDQEVILKTLLDIITDKEKWYCHPLNELWSRLTSAYPLIYHGHKE